MLGPHMILQLVLEVTPVATVPTGEALFLPAVVGLVTLEGLNVSEALLAPGALVEVFGAEATVLAAVVQVQRGLVLADEGT